MEKTFEQELIEKKEKIEKILAEKITEKEWFTNRIGKHLYGGYDPNKANAEETDLEVEALQFFIDEIDRELRKQSEFEPESEPDQDKFREE